MQRRHFITSAVGSAAILGAPSLRAQTLPTGPIRIVVGFPPGGGTDALARVVGQKLQTLWGNPVVVDNKAGAAGIIAADFVSKQAPDGNTLLMAHINSHALGPALTAWAVAPSWLMTLRATLRPSAWLASPPICSFAMQNKKPKP